jgi:cytoskeletal protein CcmA (bactofilin family)
MWKRDTSSSPLPRRIEPTTTEEVVMNLGKSVIIKGELSASEDLTLYGQMEGRVTVPDHTLTIGPDANIRAEITASTVVIMGAVSGNITATKRVDVQSTGSVIGDIVAPRIAIADGGQLMGKVQMTDEQARIARRSA